MNRDTNKDWLRKLHNYLKARNNNNIASSSCNPPILFDYVLKYFVEEPFVVMRNQQWLKLQPLRRTLTAYCSGQSRPSDKGGGGAGLQKNIFVGLKIRGQGQGWAPQAPPLGPPLYRACVTSKGTCVWYNAKYPCHAYP